MLCFAFPVAAHKLSIPVKIPSFFLFFFKSFLTFFQVFSYFFSSFFLLFFKFFLAFFSSFFWKVRTSRLEPRTTESSAQTDTTSQSEHLNYVSVGQRTVARGVICQLTDFLIFGFLRLWEVRLWPFFGAPYNGPLEKVEILRFWNRAWERVNFWMRN